MFLFFSKRITTGPVGAGRAVRRELLQKPVMVPNLSKSIPMGAGGTLLTVHIATWKSATKLVSRVSVYGKKGKNNTDLGFHNLV